MNRTWRAALLALFLTAVGLTIFLHKVFSANVPLLPNQTYQSWYLETKISIKSERSLLESEQELPQTIALQLPQNSQRYTITREDFVDDGFNRQLTSPKQSPNRLAVFTNQGKTTEKVLFYRAIIDELPISGADNSENGSVPLAGRRLVNQQFNQYGEGNEVKDNLEENLPAEEIQDLIAEARQGADGRLSIAKNLYQLALKEQDIRIQAIRKTLASNLSAAELTAFLLKRGQIDARIGNGILLTQKEAYSTDFVHWLEVKDGENWLAYDPVEGSFGSQNRYLTWWYGNTSPVLVQGSGDVELEVLVRPNTDSGLNQAIWQDRAQSNLFVKYSLLSLPLATQRVFQVLVLVPIGALIISLLHQIIGVKTFGTFTPVLIALAFRETGLIVGIPLFVLIVVLGLLIRAYLNRLQLLIVPRLAAILTATVLIMIGLAIAMDYFDISFGLSISLFPIVILGMTIESAALMWEEEGKTEVAIAGVGSITVAVIGYLCMVNDYVQYLTFAFPEVLLPVLGLNVLVGRYNGYKLTEYLRFRAMQRQLSQSGG
ncbi:MAG: UUP1 family membrane protein [Coleofasciculaceae cyanobacterium]